jgi:hypothetical protein
MSRTWLISLAALVLFAGDVWAQIPKGDIFFGYSYARAPVSVPFFNPDTFGIRDNGSANLNGWNASVAVKALPFLRVVADASGHYGTQDVTDLCGFINIPCHSTPDTLRASMYNFLFGPRLAVTVGRFTPFAHALFGVGHISEHTNAALFSDTATGFADALGGGIDYRLMGPLGWRAQADVVEDRFFHNRQDNFRFSTGVALHF